MINFGADINILNILKGVKTILIEQKYIHKYKNVNNICLLSFLFL